MSRVDAGPTGHRHTVPAPAASSGDGLGAATAGSGAAPLAHGSEGAAARTGGDGAAAPAGGSEGSADPAGGEGAAVASGRSHGGWERVIVIAGVVVSIVAAFVTGVVELLLSTLRAGDVVTIWRGDAIGSGSGPVLGLSILLAIAGNLAIAWFAVSTTRRRWAIGPPWALWTLLMLFAAGIRTHEGDYLLGGGNWVALVMILAGSLAFAVYSYRMIVKGAVPR